jgi:hypothetical protein
LRSANSIIIDFREYLIKSLESPIQFLQVDMSHKLSNLVSKIL